MSNDSDSKAIPFPRLEFAHANEPLVSSARRLDGGAAPQPDRAARLDDLRERLRRHCARHKPVWIGRETFKLTVERLKPGLDHPTPQGVERGTTSPAMIYRHARQNVESRITRRLSRVNAMRAPETARRQSPALGPLFNRRNRITP
jgi:hypothetical protein